jgi:hypothetical protein
MFRMVPPGALPPRSGSEPEATVTDVQPRVVATLEEPQAPAPEPRDWDENGEIEVPAEADDPAPAPEPRDEDENGEIEVPIGADPPAPRSADEVEGEGGGEKEKEGEKEEKQDQGEKEEKQDQGEKEEKQDQPEKEQQQVRWIFEDEGSECCILL